MRRNRFLVAVILAWLGLVAGHRALAMSNWDGRYQVTIEYSRATSLNPQCVGWLFDDPFVVSGDKISGVLRHSGHRHAIFIKGTVADDGSFTAKASSGSATADVVGQLTSAGAKGTWQEKPARFVPAIGLRSSNKLGAQPVLKRLHMVFLRH